MRLTILFFTALLGLSGVAAAADARTPAVIEAVATTDKTEKATDRAVRITQALEVDPFRDGADAMREDLGTWVEETPDYMVSFCNVLGPIPDDETVPNGRELMLQHMFGNVTYQIQHPGKTDVVALQVAAMQSLLRVYAVFIQKDPKGARIPYFDKLLSEERNGTLKEHLRPLVVKRCLARKKEE